MIQIFDLMLDDNVVNMFLRKNSFKYSAENEKFIALKTYVTSEQYKEDVTRLKNGDYFLPVPTKYLIKKHTSSRYRPVYVFPDRFQYLLKVMAFATNCYDFMYSKSLYSFRRKRNHKFFFQRLKKVDRYRKLYVYKTDIHHYAESMDVDILLNVLKKILENDPDFYNFLYWLLKRNQYMRNGELVEEEFPLICGVPLGGFFFNVYLMHVDKELEAKYPLYMRYADDIAVFCKKEEDLKDIEKYLLDEFHKVKLEHNPDKTQIYKPGEPFDILGFQCSVNEVDVAPYSVQKLISKIDRKERRILRRIRYEKCPPEQMFGYAYGFYRKLFLGNPKYVNDKSWTVWTFSTITTDKALKVIDKRIEDLLRVVLSGKKGEARYRVSYEELQKRGYVPLVRLYHDRNKLMNIKDKILKD